MLFIERILLEPKRRQLYFDCLNDIVFVMNVTNVKFMNILILLIDKRVRQKVKYILLSQFSIDLLKSSHYIVTTDVCYIVHRYTKIYKDSGGKDIQRQKNCVVYPMRK